MIDWCDKTPDVKKVTMSIIKLFYTTIGDRVRDYLINVKPQTLDLINQELETIVLPDHLKRDHEDLTLPISGEKEDEIAIWDVLELSHKASFDLFEHEEIDSPIYLSHQLSNEDEFLISPVKTGNSSTFKDIENSPPEFSLEMNLVDNKQVDFNQSIRSKVNI